MQVWWRSGHSPARSSDLRKSLQTYRQTDRRTDDGRLAIVLAHSWNELTRSVIMKDVTFDALVLVTIVKTNKRKYI